MDYNIYGSIIICNKPKLETIQIPINIRMDQ